MISNSNFIINRNMSRLSYTFDESAKENVNRSNQMKVSLEQSTSIFEKWSFDELDSSDDDDVLPQFRLKLKNVLVKKSLKDFISNFLSQRKRIDLEQSYIAISNDHKTFKIFKEWKKQTKQSNALHAEGEFLKEKQQFEKMRAVFKKWSQLVANNKKAARHFQGKVFSKLKMACTSQLLIRLRKIELNTHRTGKYWKEFLHNMKENRTQEHAKARRASRHYTQQLKQIYFDKFVQNMQSLKQDNLRYHQYKLAFLFRKTTLLRRSFSSLFPLSPSPSQKS